MSTNPTHHADASGILPLPISQENPPAPPALTTTTSTIAILKRKRTVYAAILLENTQAISHHCAEHKAENLWKAATASGCAQLHQADEHARFGTGTVPPDVQDADKSGCEFIRSLRNSETRYEKKIRDLVELVEGVESGVVGVDDERVRGEVEGMEWLVEER
jgi:hypothetical protein